MRNAIVFEKRYKRIEEHSNSISFLSQTDSRCAGKSEVLGIAGFFGGLNISLTMLRSVSAFLLLIAVSTNSAIATFHFPSTSLSKWIFQ